MAWVFSVLGLKDNFVVHANDEDELIDPHDTLKEECKIKHCKDLFAKLEECNARVNSKTQTTETCAEEEWDYLACADHIIAKSLFSKLK